MLGTRTKQINAYGKRARRVVDATDSNLITSNAEILSIFDDMPAPPELKSLARKMKNRENMVEKGSSVKVVGLQRKKRLSPILSPVRKKQTTRVEQIVGDETPKPKVSTITKPKPKALASGKGKHPVVLSTSPLRAPLSAVALNIQGSPAISRTPCLAQRKTPPKSKKRFSPFVDLEIVVLDDDGRTIGIERRVSKPKMNKNSTNQPQRSKPPVKTKSFTSADSDGEYETDNVVRPFKREVTRNHAIILSDDSDSEEENQFSKSKHVDSKETTGILKTSTKLSRSNSIMEVLIPPAPYKLPFPLTANREPPLPLQDNDVIFHSISPLNAPPQAKSAAPRSDSPILRPRQLTPIRGSRKRMFKPPSPPSPGTPTDFDLSVDFSDLTLGSVSQTLHLYQSDLEIPPYLLPLLEECHQEMCGPHNFSAFIESFPYDSILQSAREIQGTDMQFRKIGEASYSEVFGIGDVVLKVIPLRDELRTNTVAENDDGPAPSDSKDVCKEIIVTRALGEVYDGFVKLLKTYVVKGRYPEVLLQLWDEYNERKGSESVRPDTFKVSQVYAIIVLPNGGPDLEAYTFHNSSRTGWRQASSLFWQVAKALAHAEHLVFFEHRDLHWGQILVKNLPAQANALKSLNLNQSSKPKTRRVLMDDPSHGVRATVIDLGLSRMAAGDGGIGNRVHWTPFDDEVFMGEGDYQFDVYRMMRAVTGGIWDGFHPITNVLWLHYLLQKVLYSKGIKPPSVPRKTKPTSETAIPPNPEISFSEKDCYDCLVDLENWLGKSIAESSLGNANPVIKGKGRRKVQAPVKDAAYVGPGRAGEIVAYGAKKGWINPSQLY